MNAIECRQQVQNVNREQTTQEFTRNEPSAARCPGSPCRAGLFHLEDAVLEAVRSVPEFSLSRVARVEAGIAFEPQAMLALLTFCYARGIYASAEIESLMRRDMRFLSLSANDYPDPAMLRRFRRYNRQALLTSLARVLAGMQGNRPTAAHPGEDAVEAPVHAVHLDEATQRLDTAILLDSED